MNGDRVIQCNIRDITSRKIAESKLIQFQQDYLRNMYEMVDALTKVIVARDAYTYQHQIRVANLAVAIATEMNLPIYAVEGLKLAALIHDIGKISIPMEILVKPLALSSIEKEMLHGHVQAGYDMLKSVNFQWPIAQIIYQHHCRLDGSGYPNGLKNSDISFFARVAGIADSFDAMLSERPYTRSIKSPHKAVNELYDLRGKLFQSEMVEQFIQSVGIYPSGSLVELNTGEVGVVISVNNLKRLRPTLMLILDTEKKKMEKLTELSLEKTSADIFISHGVSTGTYDIDLNDLFI